MKNLKSLIVTFVILPQIVFAGALKESGSGITDECKVRIIVVAKKKLAQAALKNSSKIYKDAAATARFSDSSVTTNGQYILKTVTTDNPILMANVYAEVDPKIASFTFGFGVQVNDRCDRIRVSAPAQMSYNSTEYMTNGTGTAY